jgi:hypothetical protein
MSHHFLAAMLVVVGAAEEQREPGPTNRMYRCAASSQRVETSQTWTIGGDRQLLDAHAASVVAGGVVAESVAAVAAVVAEEKPCW